MFPQWGILSFSRPAVCPWISSQLLLTSLFSSSGGIKVDSILMWALYRRKLGDLALKSNRLNALKKDFYRISHLSILLALRGVNFSSQSVCKWKESVVHWAAMCKCSSHFMLRTVNRKKIIFSLVSFSLPFSLSSGCAYVWPVLVNRGVLFTQGFECICAY